MLVSGQESKLQYGDIICIRHTVEDARVVYLSSKGFTDPEVYAQETSELNWKDRFDNMEFNISNYRDFLFEITPKLSFQFMVQLKEYIQSGMKLAGPVGKVQEVDEDDENITNMEKRKKLEDLAKAEAQQNQRKSLECKGEVILFGAEVGFKHVDSGYYLAGDKDASGAVNTGYKCLLRHEFSAASVFELSSFYKSKKNGDAIYHNNVVVIRNNYNNCCLTFDARSHLRFNYPLARKAEDPLRPDTFHRDPFCKMRNTFYSTEVAIGWSFDKLVDSQPFLKNLKLGSPISLPKTHPKSEQQAQNPTNSVRPAEEKSNKKTEAKYS